jgi:ATP-dependent RNA helicase RhlE
VDDFFLKPYEPSSAAAPADEQESRSNASPSSAPKRQLAVLLGGSRKP